MSKLPNIILALLGRGGPQTKKVAFLYGILVASIWLTIGLWVPITAEWNVALAIFLGAVTTGYVGGKKVGSQARPAPGGESVDEPAGCVHTADRGIPPAGSPAGPQGQRPGDSIPGRPVGTP